MENKYYTPDISEFFVGFEYEIIYPDGEIKKFEFDILDMDRALNPETKDFIGGIRNQIEKKYVRVKYLDKSDIEELGFILSCCIEMNGIETYSKFCYRLDYYRNSVCDRNLISIYDLANKDYVFKGFIKNKSELKKLLIQIGING